MLLKLQSVHLCCLVLTIATPYLYLVKRLQEVQNAAARSILRTPRSEHISPLLQKLHWLPVYNRILYKISALCHNSPSGSGPQYLSDHSPVYTPARSLRSSSDTRITSTSNVKLKSYGQRSFTHYMEFFATITQTSTGI